ncbi:hypothetical protein Rhal01_02514 [Rubritalea halochordaticola]|uniref:DUF3347 domain-containing protein n=1 Tax=Rubritalea halochordaticola TaxID=714537 RepID=A0ABP9V0W4_9BACT
MKKLIAPLFLLTLTFSQAKELPMKWITFMKEAGAAEALMADMANPSHKPGPEHIMETAKKLEEAKAALVQSGDLTRKQYTYTGNPDEATMENMSKFFHKLESKYGYAASREMSGMGITFLVKNEFEFPHSFVGITFTACMTETEMKEFFALTKGFIKEAKE